MKKMFTNVMVSTQYESPSVIELQVANEGVLCASKGATEKLSTNYGSWTDLQ